MLNHWYHALFVFGLVACGQKGELYRPTPSPERAPIPAPSASESR